MYTRAFLWAAALCAAPALAQSQQPSMPPASQQQQPSTPTANQQPQQQPGTGGSAAQAATSASFRNKAPQAVVRAIEERTREWEQAFNRHDVDTLAAFFTQDATLLTPDGQASDGREDIERQLRRDHTGPMRAARTSLTVRSVRALSPTLVIADLANRMEGVQMPAGSATGGSGTANAMDQHVTLTATKQGNTWKLVAVRVFPAPTPQPQQGVGGSGLEGSEGTEDPQPPPSTPSPDRSEDPMMPSDPMTSPPGQPPQGADRPIPPQDGR